MSDVTTYQPPNFERCLDAYFQDINRYPLLKQDDEIALARRIQDGDQEALQLLVLSNLRFVVSVAKRYANQGLALSDLISEGNIGLLKAATRFDADRGFRFISYAVWWIRQCISQALKDKSRTVRLPHTQNTLLGKIKKAQRKLQADGVLNPDNERVAEMLEKSPMDIDLALAADRVMLEIHDTGESDNQRPLVETLAAEDQESPDENILQGSMRGGIERGLTNLTDREAEIVKRYFGLGYDNAQTLQEIGEHLGLTRERIRQIKQQALDKLRGIMIED